MGEITGDTVVRSGLCSTSIKKLSALLVGSRGAAAEQAPHRSPQQSLGSGFGVGPSEGNCGGPF